MKPVALALVLFVFVVSTALAQVPTIASVKVDIFRAATPTTLVTSVTVPWSTFTCNLPKTVLPPVTVNPANAEFDDPALAGRACKGSIATTLDARTPDQYVAAYTFIYSDGISGGTSTPSNPFTRSDYQTPQGAKVVR